MQDLMPPINTPDSAFHDGDPTTGQLGTIVTALWLNNVQSATRDVQLEIKNVLAKAGIQPDPKKTNQLAEAISQIIGSGNYASTAYVDNGLNKKIDKASISGVLGNDNSKVPSLNLLATELGKKQPAGNYQPAGDYATNTALNNGLNTKLNTTGGAMSGPLGVQKIESTWLSGTNKQVLSASTAALYLGNPVSISELRLQTNNGNVRVDVGLATYSVYHEANVRKDPKGYLCTTTSKGTVLQEGDYGLGSVVGFNESGFNAPDNPFGGVNGTGATKMVSPPKNGSYQSYVYWTMGGKLRIAGYTISPSGTKSEVVEFYSTGNTTVDRSGYIRTASTTEQMQSVPIGSSILWNTSAPIPDNFWPNEGRSFSASEYPELAKIFTNLRLPDDRGYGIRVADNGKGIDAGRTVGTYQEDAVQSVTGSVRNLAATSADYQYAGAFFGSDKGGIEYASGSSGQRFRTLGFDIGRVARTANETRMKNVAKILITRVK